MTTSTAARRLPCATRRIAALTLAALAGAAGAAPPALRAVPLTCVPATAATAAAQQALPLSGGVRHLPGRETPPLHHYICPVPDPGLRAGERAWSSIALTYGDGAVNGVGHATLELRIRYFSNRPGDPPPGATRVLGRVQSTPFTALHTVTAPLAAPLDFARGTHFLLLTMQAGDAPVEVHEVALLP